MYFLIGGVLWGFLSHFSKIILDYLGQSNKSRNISELMHYAAGWVLAAPVEVVLAYAVEPDEGKKRRTAVMTLVIHLAAGVIFGSGVALGRLVEFITDGD